jgi:WD40 repeat protein
MAYENISLSFSPDGKYVLTSANNNQLFAWELSTGRIIKKWNPSKLGSITWSPNGKAFLSTSMEYYSTSSSSSRVDLYYLEENNSNNVVTNLLQTKSPFIKADWSPDGKWIYVHEYNDFSREDKGILVFDSEDNKIIYTPESHWQLENFSASSSFKLAFVEDYFYISFQDSIGNSRIKIGRPSKKIINLKTFKPAFVFASQNSSQAPWTGYYTMSQEELERERQYLIDQQDWADKNLLRFINWKLKNKSWDESDEKKYIDSIQKIQMNAKIPVPSRVKFSNNDEYFLGDFSNTDAFSNNKIILYKIKTGEAVVSSEGWLRDFMFSENSKWLFEEKSDTTRGKWVSWWDIDEKKKVQKINCDFYYFSTDSTYLIASNEKEEIMIYELKSGKKIYEFRERVEWGFSDSDKYLWIRSLSSGQISMFETGKQRLLWTQSRQAYNPSRYDTKYFFADDQYFKYHNIITRTNDGIEIYNSSHTFTTDFVNSNEVLIYDSTSIKKFNIELKKTIWEVKWNSKNIYCEATKDKSQIAIADGLIFQLIDWNTGKILLTKHLNAANPRWYFPKKNIMVLVDQSAIYKIDLRNKKTFPFASVRALPVKQASFAGNEIMVSSGKNIFSWSLSGTQILRSYTRHTDVLNMCNSNDGRYLVYGSADSLITIWDITKNKLVHTLKSNTNITALAISNNNKYILCGGSNRVKLYDIKTGRILREKTDTLFFPTDLAFSPDDQYFAVTNYRTFRSPNQFSKEHDGSLKLFSAEDFQQLADTDMPCFSVVFSKDGQRLLTFGIEFKIVKNKKNILLISDTTLKHTLDVPLTEEEFNQIKGTSFNNLVSNTIYSNDEKSFIGGYESGEIINKTFIHDRPISSLGKHEGEIIQVTSSPEQGRMLSVSKDYSVKLWNIVDGKEICQFIIFDNNSWLITTPDGYYMASKEGAKNVQFVKDNKVYLFDEFDLQYNRPDIVLERIGKAPKELIDAYKRAYEKRRK